MIIIIIKHEKQTNNTIDKGVRPEDDYLITHDVWPWVKRRRRYWHDRNQVYASSGNHCTTYQQVAKLCA